MNASSHRNSPRGCAISVDRIFCAQEYPPYPHEVGNLYRGQKNPCAANAFSFFAHHLPNDSFQLRNSESDCYFLCFGYIVAHLDRPVSLVCVNPRLDFRVSKPQCQRLIYQAIPKFSSSISENLGIMGKWKNALTFNWHSFIIAVARDKIRLHAV